MEKLQPQEINSMEDVFSIFLNKLSENNLKGLKKEIPKEYDMKPIFDKAQKDLLKLINDGPDEFSPEAIFEI